MKWKQTKAVPLNHRVPHVEITQKNVRYPAVVVFFGVSDFLIFSKCLSYTDYYDLKKKKTL